jgi:hypothetical protein
MPLTTTCRIAAANAVALLILAGAAVPARTQSTEAPRRNLVRPWLGARYDLDAVSGLDAWQELTVEGAQPVGATMLIARGREARRFGSYGTQVEGEAYPQLDPLTYLYLGVAGSSSSDVYPTLRVAGEAYRELPAAWEVSLGGRYARTPAVQLRTITGTIARYMGDWWLSARPSYTSYSGEHARSLSGVARRYFSGRYDYVSMTVAASAGADPEASDPLRLERAATLHGWAAHVERLRPVGDRLRLRYGAGYEREELAAGGPREHRTIVVGADWVMP